MLYRFRGKLLGVTNDDTLIVYPTSGVKFIPLSDNRECLSFTLEDVNSGQSFLAVYLGNEVEIPKPTSMTLNLGSNYVFELVYRREEDEYTIKNLYTVTLKENRFDLKTFPLMLDTVRYVGEDT